MTISISNIAWETCHDPEVAVILQRHQVRQIDIAPGKYFKNLHHTTNAEIDAVNNWWQQRGISIFGMQALLFGTQGLNIFGPADVQQHMLDHLREVCRIGDRLGARRLVFGSPKNRDRSGLGDEEAHSVAHGFFSRLAAIAASYGVVVCLEPNPTCYGANFMTTSACTAEVVEAVNHPAVRMQFDSGAISLNGENASEVCGAYGHLIGHVHASEPQLLPVGIGGCDHTACAAALAVTLPDVLVSIEMLTSTVAEPLATIEASVAFVRKTYI
jgi:sugar phosphate isomerase/epimerase